MQDHRNGHRCYGHRLSMHEKCAHRQGLHCSGVGWSFAVLRPAGQDHKARRAGTGERRVNQALQKRKNPPRVHFQKRKAPRRYSFIGSGFSRWCSFPLQKSGQPFWGCPQKDVLFSSLDKWEVNELTSLLFQHNHLHDLC